MVLFLGSGVSIPSGLPSVEQVRDSLLSSSGDPEVAELLTVIEKMDKQYLRCSAPFEYAKGEYRYTGQHYRTSTTYEDLFYLVAQLYMNGTAILGDAAIGAFSDRLLSRARVLLGGGGKRARGVRLQQLVERAQTYIEDHVSELLVCPTPSGLDLLEELVASPWVPRLRIVTLNHDTLVEQIFHKNGTAHCDGFGPADGDVRWFANDFGSDRVQLLKPHGSICWWRASGGRVVQPVDPANRDPAGWRDGRGQKVALESSTPCFLTGAGKVLSYNRGIFSDQHFQFRQVLTQENTIVMSGYGWRDVGISHLLHDWLVRNAEHRLLILHQTPEVLADGSLILRNIYDMCIRNGQILPVRKWMQDVTAAELAPLVSAGLGTQPTAS